MSTLDVVGGTGHPSVSIMLNTLGLNAERNGNQTAKALKYYLASLFERRKTACINTEKLVVPLCNVGKLLSGIQGKHVAALRLLNEAQIIRRCYGRLHPTTSLVLKYISEVYKRQHLIEESIPPLLEALDIYQHINADFNLITSLYSDIAHSYLLINKQRHAIIYFQKILNAKNQIVSLRPDNTHVASSLEHIVRLSTETQEIQKYYVEDLLTELKRLSQIRALRRTQKTKYLTQIGHYSYSLLLMENRISMQENQTGLSIESIPEVCSHCQQYMTIGQCSKPAYLKLVCCLSNGVS
ncbi:kinesin light chain [Octopus bimaculoides]|nr:kinesin light chain [Octopus bimaculoides]|eukprot:XP_014769677.1 PREDICTED: kinesin light chain-like [Octopus bimaculoides]